MGYFIIIWMPFLIWYAIRLKRHPERDPEMQRVMKEQKGAEYEKRMQKFLFFSYLYFIVFCVLADGLDPLFEIVSNVTFFLTFIMAWFIVRWCYIGKFNKWGFIALAVLLSLGIGYHIWASQSSKVEVLPDKLSIEGNYGIAIPYQSFDSVFIVNELPETTRCIDGHNLFCGKKGEYRIKNGPVAKFYVLRKEAPYLMMYTYPGLIFVNRKTAAETEQLIEELRDKIGDKIESRSSSQFED